MNKDTDKKGLCSDEAIEAFVAHLREFKSDIAFNPWNDYDEDIDIDESAPETRAANFIRYLKLRKNASYLFIAEGVGYQGGRFSGMAMTSERILLGHHKEVRPEEVLGRWDYRRTSNPECGLLNRTQKSMGFNEPTATIMWGSLHKEKLGTFDAILWNIFPFHPYKKGNFLSNRTPTSEELDIGIVYAKELLELMPQIKIVAIGKKSAQTLAKYGIECSCVPHPSMGGANDFRAAVSELFSKKL